ncbi:hypothetical protein [Niallia taxi]|uniref:hypothetical protein n=1 Tax=Niallia taxi TaxID=2499688 RepID=UPI002E23F035|nr:hypothetical protein [Niallia taxi]
MKNEVINITQNKYDSHILPLFWQKGEGKEKIREYMQKMKESDIHEFIVESRPFPEFGQQKWWDNLRFIINTAKELNMKVWLFDDSHFPTGYVNGKVKDYPGRGKKVLKHHIINVVGPRKNVSVYTHIPYPVDDTLKFFGAVAISNGELLVLKNDVKDGKLYFSVPDGVWNICLINISEKTDICPDYINMVDKESCDILIKEVYETHYEQFKDDFGTTIAGFFTDEPGFLNEKGTKGDSLIGKDMPLPWSKQVEEKLVEYYGESYLIKIPHLWIEINDETPKVRKAYMDIVTNLFKENFNENLGNWCREHNVMHIGHIIEDRDSHARLGVGPGHFFRSMIGQDMSGVDVVFNQIIPGIDEQNHTWIRGVWDGEFFHYALAKLASSLGHIDEKKQGRTVAEVFGAYGWHTGIKLMKWIVDHFLVRGVNYFIPHAFSPKAFPDEDCPPHFYANGNNPQFKYFKDLMVYTNKMSTMLSGGKPAIKVALLYHAEAEWTGEFMFTQKPAKVLTQNQIDFDIIPTDVFGVNSDYNVSLKDGLEINNHKYEVLVIPYAEYIAKSLYDFIKNNKQFKVYFVDKLPSRFYDSEDYLDLNRLENVSIVKLENLAQELENKGLKGIITTKYEKYLRFYHYQKNDNDYYMFFNEDPVNSIVDKLIIKEKAPRYQFDVLRNRMTKFDGTLSLAPYESVILVSTLEDLDDVIVNLPVLKGEELSFDYKYKLSYASSINYPNFDFVKELEKLEDLSIEILSGKSGTFRYEFEVNVEEDLKRVLLYLDEVYEIAEVFVNDQNCGVRICPPYIFEVNNLRKGKNTIKIDITNTVDKQVIEPASAFEPINPTGILNHPKFIV